MREANRALYVDFEGRKGQPPALLGTLFGGSFELLVLDGALLPLVRAGGLTGVSCRCCTLDRAIQHLLERAAGNGAPRRVVAFSEHELATIEAFSERSRAQAVASHYLNALHYFRSWRAAVRPDLILPETSLEHCAAAVGYEWPHEGDFSPADAIRRLREQLATASRTNREPSARTRDLWRRLVEYNRQDCLAMQSLVRHIAESRGREERAALHARTAERLARRAANRRAARRGRRPATSGGH